MEHCVEQITSRLSLKNFAETLVVANRVGHHGLQIACVEFANQKENRCVDNPEMRASSALHLRLKTSVIHHNIARIFHII